MQKLDSLKKSIFVENRTLHTERTEFAMYKFKLRCQDGETIMVAENLCDAIFWTNFDHPECELQTVVMYLGGGKWMGLYE